MVSASLIRFSLSGRNDANPVPSYRVGYEQQPLLHHAYQDEASLGGGLRVIRPFDSEGVLERFACHFEGDGMEPPVAYGFPIIPLESVVLHGDTEYP